jgi:hypothetical protein
MQGQFSPIAATIATRAITHQPSYAEKVYSYITDALNPPNQEQRPIKGVSENDLHSNRYTPIYASQTTFFKDLPLIDHERLTTSQTNFKDKFQELLQRFINNLIRRDNELQIGVSNNDQAAILNALHSFLGVAGYVGAHALHQYVKQRLYPAVYAGHMPDEEAWVETVHALVQISVDALQRDWVYE